MMEAMDVRDGLNPFLRQAYSVLWQMTRDVRYQKSVRVIQEVARVTGVEEKLAYDALVDCVWPHSPWPMVEGQGNFWFPPAAPEFSEIGPADMLLTLADWGRADVTKPLAMPAPYALIAGTPGYCHCKTKIPPHDPVAVIEGTIALLKDPAMDTKALVEHIKGPALLVGGQIDNPEELCDIYDRGSGVIRIRLTEENLGEELEMDEVADWCNWYGYTKRKIRNRESYHIHIPYHALLWDGTQCRPMSLKELLQKYLEHYRACEPDMSDEELCRQLQEIKDCWITEKSTCVE